MLFRSTLFDSADVYGGRGKGEEFLGQALGPRRKDIVLISKFGKPMNAERTKMGASRRYVMEACDASLKRLGTDWIDLYQMHDPDPLTPIEETLRALDDLVKAGKICYFGASHFAAWQLVEAHYVARMNNLHRMICCEDEYSVLVRKAEKELLPASRACGMGIMPYYPLASEIGRAHV